VLASAACGLLGAPGEYATASGESSPEGSVGPTPEAGPGQPDVIVLEDGKVIPASAGTIALVAGEREPTSGDDDPAWSSDAWSAILSADGHVERFRIDVSAPITGSFDCAGLIGPSWFMLNTGFGLAGNRGTAIQSTSWAPGVVGDWRAARANPPGGLDEHARAFFGTHVAFIGGTRTTAGVDGGPATTVFVNEAQRGTVDPATGLLGTTSNSGSELVLARSRPTVVFAGGHLYVVGGRAAVTNGVTGTVEMANADGTAGTIAAFATQPAMMVGGAEHRIFTPGVVVANGYLFVAGGRVNTNAPTDVVLSSKIDPATGALGDFQELTKLPRPLRDFAFVAHQGRLYVFGGVGVGTPLRTDEVLTTTIAADGTIGAWDPANARLPGRRSDFVALAY